jgi:hypothetical protein
MVVLSASPVVRGNGQPGTANGTLYRAPSGALVFDAGTVYWPWKLDDNSYQQHGADPRVQRITTNLLTAMGVTPLSQVKSAPALLSLTVYDDALAGGWGDWSWGSTRNFGATTPVYSGTHSLSYTATAGWGGLQLHSSTAIATSTYSALQFAVQASQAGQRYAVFLTNASNQQLAPATPLANYGGDPVAGAWKVYTIPLADLHAVGTQISGITIQEWTGHPQPALYVDELGFVGTSAVPPTATPTPVRTPTAAPTSVATATQTATPQPTATPTLNPAAPAAPDKLTATFVSSNQSVKLNWRDHATNESGFEIQRSANGASSFVTIARVKAGTHSYVDSAPPSGTYYYRVRAYTAAGLTSAFSNTASATVP